MFVAGHDAENRLPFICGSGMPGKRTNNLSNLWRVELPRRGRRRERVRQLLTLMLLA